MEEQKDSEKESSAENARDGKKLEQIFFLCFREKYRQGRTRRRQERLREKGIESRFKSKCKY